MKRKTVILFSLLIALLLAGLCSCKQEATPETLVLNAGVSGVSIPEWEKSDDGLQNLPEAVTSGTATGVSEALVSGLKNPPVFEDANNLIVLVCEGLTSEMIESSKARYADGLILDSFPVRGTTLSKFTSDSGDLLVDYVRKVEYLFTGIAAWGDTSTNSLRRMTTNDGNEVASKKVNYNQFMINPPLCLIMGKGDFEDAFAADELNLLYKSSGYPTVSLSDAVSTYRNKVHFDAFDDAHPAKDVNVKKLYVIFENDSTLPSFRQETAFALAWMQERVVEEMNGFCLLMSYSPASALSDADVQDFDEAVAVAVKFVLENPDTALVVCGCPADGSAAPVCFYGLGKNVSEKNTLYECVTSIF